MGQRKCPEHGWQSTREYTVNESGETVCGREGCEKALHGFKMNGERVN